MLNIVSPCNKNYFICVWKAIKYVFTSEQMYIIKLLHSNFHYLIIIWTNSIISKEIKLNSIQKHREKQTKYVPSLTEIYVH